MPETPQTNLIFDFTNPDRGMLQRDGEDPISAIVAAIPTHSEIVTIAMEQLNTALMTYMDPDEIILVLQDAIQLQSGHIIELSEDSLFFSLTYPTATARMFEMQLGTPSKATLH